MPKPKRPRLKGEHPTFDRDDWREDVANENTDLGYWEWVWHQLDASRPPAENNLRQLPGEVAGVINPFDVWGMSHDIRKMPEAAQFVQVLCAITSCEFNSEQRDYIAEKMCIESEVLDEILDLAEKRSEEIITSIQEHNA